jgi:hypothetical protein
VDYTVTVALKVVAITVLRLGMAASARIFHAYRVVGEHGKKNSFKVSEFQGFKVESCTLKLCDLEALQPAARVFPTAGPT